MNLIVIIVAISVVVVVLAMWYLQRRQRRAELVKRFGPEYDRTVEASASRAAAEKDLAKREKRVARLQLKDLGAPQVQQYTAEWQGAQGRFVDSPGGAIQEADELVQRIMVARGYPMSDFEQQAADVSVGHPSVVINYRAAHRIADRNAVEPASTEDLRQAMVHYRALFEELLIPSESVPASGKSDEPAQIL